MLITTSPDITNLSVRVTWDISNTSPQINLVNLSTGSGLANCSWWFVATSPTGTFIHQGSETSPDKTGVWTSASLTDAWPRPFNQIEWSAGAPYTFQVFCKDSDGNIFEDSPQTVTICRPSGNTSLSKNTFGLAGSNIAVKCQEGRVFFEDTTYHTYKGNDGTEIGSVLKVIYPIDETGNIPTPFIITNYATALVPISYSSDTYQFWQYSIYDYDFGNNTLVRIKYQVINPFAVWCNVDLEPLVCEFNKLIDSVENGSCNDADEANRKLAVISPKMVLAFMGIMQPLTGVDVPSLVEEIKTIGGFDCNCCGAPTGIIPQAASVIDGYSFSVNPVCGDVRGTVAVNGYNITFNLQDVSYVVSVSNDSPSETSAFSFVPSVDACQKTYALKVDGNQLATDILNIIKNDSGLVNIFNSIVNGGASGNILVDGKCIFQTSSSCDYTFDFLNIPVSTSFAILTGINGSPVNYAFNQSNLTAFQSYLNALGYGAFVVTNPTSGEILLTSTGNTHSLTQMTYTVAGVNYSAAMTRDCTGYTPITASAAVQAIVDYLCGFTDAEVLLSENYTICYIDPVSKTQKTVTIEAGASLAAFISELIARNCDTVTYVSGISADTCTAIRGLFQTSVKTLQPTDVVLGTKQGICASITPLELGTRILQFGISDVAFFNAFCALVTACSGGAPCAPFNYFYLSLPYSSPTDDTMDIIANFNHPAAIAYTVRYARIDNTNTPVYTTIPSVLSSPYVISGVADGQYNVGITPIYSDGRKCTETMQTTPACAGINSFSAVLGGSPTSEFVISYSASSSIPKVKVNISYPNGGSWSHIYTNDGSEIDIPFPTNVYGSFSINMQPVCNSDTGFFGQPTAPVILTINDSSSPSFASLSLSFTASGGSGPYLYFAAVSAPLDASINVSTINVNGYTSGDCSGSPIANSQKSNGLTILAGSTNNSGDATGTTGTWGSAVTMSMYGVVVNGVSVTNGSVIIVGSYNVTVLISTCGSA